MTDPAEPLFGQRFRVERVAGTPQDVAHVFLRRDDGIVLRVPLRATSLSTLVRHAPRVKLCKQAVQEFLDLVKEYEQCGQKSATRSAKSGPRSGRRTPRRWESSVAFSGAIGKAANTPETGLFNAAARETKREEI